MDENEEEISFAPTDIMLKCLTTAKGFIQHSAIYPCVSSKPISIFQGFTCPPKLDQIRRWQLKLHFKIQRNIEIALQLK